MLKKDEVLKHISDRLTNIGFYDYGEGTKSYKYAMLFSNVYSVSVRFINENNMRCELNKREVIGGMVFSGNVMTSCVVSDWHKDQIKIVDDWVDNILIIPEIILKIRSNKIKKITG